MANLPLILPDTVYSAPHVLCGYLSHANGPGLQAAFHAWKADPANANCGLMGSQSVVYNSALNSYQMFFYYINYLQVAKPVTRIDANNTLSAAPIGAVNAQ